MAQLTRRGLLGRLAAVIVAPRLLSRAAVVPPVEIDIPEQLTPAEAEELAAVLAATILKYRYFRQEPPVEILALRDARSMPGRDARSLAQPDRAL